MFLRTIKSILQSFIEAQTVEELHAEAMHAKTLELGEDDKEFLNKAYAERKKELSQ